MVRIGERVLFNVRLVNYEQEGGRCYTPTDDGMFRNRNATVEWDPVTGTCGPARESAGVPADWPTATEKLGLEDMRWTVHAGRVWFTAACYQSPLAVDRCRIVLGRMNEALDGIDHLVPLQREELRVAEKNWLPWSRDGELLVIYGYDPFEVRTVDLDTGATALAQRRPPAFYAGGFRGSAPPVRVPGRAGRWLLLTHDVAYRPQGNAYAQRFVEVDEHDGIVAISRPVPLRSRGHRVRGRAVRSRRRPAAAQLRPRGSRGALAGAAVEHRARVVGAGGQRCRVTRTGCWCARSASPTRRSCTRCDRCVWAVTPSWRR